MKKQILSIVASVAITATSLIAQEKAYAIVNGTTITNADIAMALRNPKIQFDTLPKLQQDKILQSLIEQTLLSQYAMKTNIPKTAEYKQELKKLKANLAFQLWMRDLGKTIKVSNKEVKDYYNEHKIQFKAPLQLKASHILVKTKKEANDIIAKLKKAKDIKATFTKLAKEYSIGPSGKNGGELGWFTKEKMVPAFSNASAKLKKGSFTKEPVQTQFGYHIIYLDDKKEAATIPFDKIKNQLKQEVTQIKFINKIKEKVTKLKKKAKIVIK